MLSFYTTQKRISHVDYTKRKSFREMILSRHRVNEISETKYQFCELNVLLPNRTLRIATTLIRTHNDASEKRPEKAPG